jgi:hypothetical protein
VLTDPGLKRQLEQGWGFGNADSSSKLDQGASHLPKTHVKTMPPEENAVSFKWICSVLIFIKHEVIK